MSRKVDFVSGSGMSGEVASNQKPQPQERTGGVPGGVKKSTSTWAYHFNLIYALFASNVIKYCSSANVQFFSLLFQNKRL